jgi:hypothetical protein
VLRFFLHVRDKSRDPSRVFHFEEVKYHANIIFFPPKYSIKMTAKFSHCVEVVGVTPLSTDGH